MGDIVEEEEEIITTLSSEDAALLAEVMKVIKGVYPIVPVHNCVMSF
jgi:hypothetical protein